MTEKLYTLDEMAEFRDILDMVDAPGMGNMSRPIGRTRQRAFVALHGKEKCDAMFATILAEDAARKRRK